MMGSVDDSFVWKAIIHTSRNSTCYSAISGLMSLFLYNMIRGKKNLNYQCTKYTNICQTAPPHICIYFLSFIHVMHIFGGDIWHILICLVYIHFYKHKPTA